MGAQLSLRNPPEGDSCFLLARPSLSMLRNETGKLIRHRSAPAATLHPHFKASHPGQESLGPCHNQGWQQRPAPGRDLTPEGQAPATLQRPSHAQSRWAGARRWAEADRNWLQPA